MDELILGALVEGIKLSPAIGILIWVAWRADNRAQACMEKLFQHLDRDHQ